ncbi:hypothetical protein AWU65_23790 [Paenibacillus glucanolyticus]|uniref:Uncharacterized protein n=1 Tax=Paenibacillus glucanolyticus TaxID=59843 RepID=A0A163M4S0_9BACL|nr:hypothetical protein AWU65_23790 [Paenibacillus glucanolyticus]
MQACFMYIVPVKLALRFADLRASAARLPPILVIEFGRIIGDLLASFPNPFQVGFQIIDAHLLWR